MVIARFEEQPWSVLPRCSSADANNSEGQQDGGGVRFAMRQHNGGRGPDAGAGSRSTLPAGEFHGGVRPEHRPEHQHRHQH